MIITRNDCLLLLTELTNNGIDIGDRASRLVTSNEIPIDIIKFINASKPLDVVNFYELLRVNSNKKRNNIYKNIVKEITDPQNVLTTLAAFNIQILLYSNKLTNKRRFFKHTRAEEILKALNNYYSTNDLTNCINLIRLIKADIKLLESIK